MTTPNSNAYAQEHYSGLEVDTRQSPLSSAGGWNADDLTKFRLADQNPSSAPQVHNPDLPEVAPYYGQDYSMPQAVDAAHGNGNGAGYGQTYYAPKENPDSPEVTEIHEEKRPKLICGMKRKMFWIVLAIAIVVVIAAGVGGGVAGSAAAANSSQSDSSSSGSGSGSGNTGVILPATNIGSLNFTDQYGWENSMVFFQLRNKKVWQSYWNASTNVWTSADAKVLDTVKEGTPISNSLLWHSTTSRDARIYYLNEDNKVMGQINGNPAYGATWDQSGVSDTYTAASTSQLLSNGQYTNDSYLDNLVVYQDSGSVIRVIRRIGSGATDWQVNGIDTGFGTPALGTSMSLIPIQTIETNKTMRLFYISTAGAIIGLTVFSNNNTWIGETLPTTVATNSSLAAFSYGYDTDLTMHVLATQEGKAPILTTYSGGEWTNQGEIAAMSGDDIPTKIAANLAGRVYGVVERNATKVEIVGWKWTNGTTYEKIGVVDVST
ncbi:hypothetical protein K4K59_000075 [Colletotrichum sp. SAR11_240]|nr:hypothetical protein K4K59_000075 [Colletotrichum sp. SAR11_240]